MCHAFCSFSKLGFVFRKTEMIRVSNTIRQLSCHYTKFQRVHFSKTVGKQDGDQDKTPCINPMNIAGHKEKAMEENYFYKKEREQLEELKEKMKKDSSKDKKKK